MMAWDYCAACGRELTYKNSYHCDCNPVAYDLTMKQERTPKPIDLDRSFATKLEDAKLMRRDDDE